MPKFEGITKRCKEGKCKLINWYEPQHNVLIGKKCSICGRTFAKKFTD